MENVFRRRMCYMVVGYASANDEEKTVFLELLVNTNWNSTSEYERTANMRSTPPLGVLMNQGFDDVSDFHDRIFTS